MFATYLAPNIKPVYELVTARVGEALARPARLIVGESFDQLRNGEVDFAFVCGLPYVRLHRENPALRVIAAPVVRGERYGGRPIYFSDVIVPADSAAASFEDLRGCTWAYNEPDSHSGYLVTLFHLYRMGETGRYFARTVRTDLHQESIRRVTMKAADASAIDSQVLAVELRDHPDLGPQLRIVDTLGPSTIQPLVATRAVSASLGEEVREIVTGLGRMELDSNLLGQGLVERFTAIDDAAYEDIAAMLDTVESSRLSFDA